MAADDPQAATDLFVEPLQLVGGTHAPPMVRREEVKREALVQIVRQALAGGRITFAEELDELGDVFFCLLKRGRAVEDFFENWSAGEKLESNTLKKLQWPADLTARIFSPLARLAPRTA